MAISMGEMKHFGTRLRAAILWPKNHVTKPPDVSNPIIVLFDKRAKLGRCNPRFL